MLIQGIDRIKPLDCKKIYSKEVALFSEIANWQSGGQS
jgi:hypothetical protein